MIATRSPPLNGTSLRDRVEQLLGDRVGALDLLAAAARLAVDADADFDLVVAEGEDRRALGRRDAAGQRDAHRADVLVDLVGDGIDLVEALALLGGGAAGLDDEEVAGHAAAADGVEAVLDRDVVVDPELARVDALGGGHLGGHVPRHPVTLVVVDQHQHAGVRGAGLDRLVACVDRRGGEHRALAGAGEHARADRHDVRRLVARARALDDRDLAIVRPALAGDQLELGVEVEQVRVGERDALMNSGTNLAGSLTNFFMGYPLPERVFRRVG
jgi:hypothetical protein